ncbi:hypothetical protein GE09DRAFT_1088528 [Coniochaeta sp. 2T2.1]|nr:hypothetical protein GE09DRAFT_1088528 [Coniochaeta sp. 2T2.1]
MPYGYLHPFHIHPTTLDGAIQSVVVAMTKGGKEIGDVMIPTSFKELWITSDTAKVQGFPDDSIYAPYHKEIESGLHGHLTVHDKICTYAPEKWHHESSPR